MLNFLVTFVNKIGVPVMMIVAGGIMHTVVGRFPAGAQSSGFGSLVWERMEDGPVWRYLSSACGTFSMDARGDAITRRDTQGSLSGKEGIVDIVIKLFMLTQLRPSP